MDPSGGVQNVDVLVGSSYRSPFTLPAQSQHAVFSDDEHCGRVSTYLILDTRKSGVRGGRLQQARALSAERYGRYRGWTKLGPNTVKLQSGMVEGPQHFRDGEEGLRM
jgi:hypothetical protein